jgi:site-specific DNA recombinase
VISERTRDKIAASRRKGLWVGGRPILGYDVAEKKLVVNETEAVLVREIFARYLEEKSLLAIAGDLNRRELRTKSRTTRKGKIIPGQDWDKNAVRRLLANPLYIGKVPYRGEQSEGVHQAIVDRETFARVQERLAERVSPVRRHLRRRWGFLLGGLVRCGLCHGAMTHHFTARGARRYSYYVCHARQQRGREGCAGSRVRVHELEEVVIDRLLEVGNDAELIAAANEAESSNRAAKEARTEACQAILLSLRPMWRCLSPDERERIIRLLIEHVTYHEATGEVVIAFQPNGVRTLMDELLERGLSA